MRLFYKGILQQAICYTAKLLFFFFGNRGKHCLQTLILYRRAALNKHGAEGQDYFPYIHIRYTASRFNTQIFFKILCDHIVMCECSILIHSSLFCSAKFSLPIAIEQKLMGYMYSPVREGTRDKKMYI